QPSPGRGADVLRPARSAQQALHRSGCSHHAEGGRDHGHRTEAAGTVQLDPFPDKALLLAYRAIRLGVAQLLQGIDAGHAEAALALGAGEIVVAAQQGAGLGRTRIWVGSIWPPAPPVVTMAMRWRRHQAISATLDATLSMQSTTQSMSGVMYSARVSGVTKPMIGRTSQAGLMARMRSAITSTLSRPMLPALPGNCRLVLVTQMSSMSIRVMRPMPVRASASAAQLPTPPIPTTAI